MIRQNQMFRTVTWAVPLFLLLAGKTPSYEIETHKTITEVAFKQSVLNQGYLGELGFSPGTLFQGREVLEWLEEGSEREDDLNFFSLRPFRVMC